MIQFHRTIGEFNNRQPVGLDEATLHVVACASRAPLPGYDYSIRAIPLSSLTRVDIVRETRGGRIWAGMLLTAGTLLVCAILLGNLRIGRVVLNPLLWLFAPLGIPAGLVLCFARRRMTVTFVVDGQKYALPLSDRRWKEYEGPILQILDRSGVRYTFYGCAEAGLVVDSAQR
jgi:hypothetical protein